MINEKNQIEMFLHCKQCMDELPQGVSPRENARFDSSRISSMVRKT